MRIFLALFSLLPFLTSAQSNSANTRFLNGGIIVNKDSIFGKVGYSARKQICFLDNPSGMRAYKPGEIDGFFVTSGGQFESLTLERDTSKTNIFLQKSIIGDSASLYLGLKGNAFFLLRKNRLVELDIKKSSKVIMPNQGVIETKNYVITLLKELSGCREIIPTVYDIRPSSTELQNLISLYNDCLGSEYTKIPALKAERNSHFGLRIGVEASRFKVKSVIEENRYASKTYLTSTSPLFGIYFNQQISRGFRKLVMVTELNFIQEKYETYNEIPYEEDSTEYNKVELKSSNIRIPLQLRIPLFTFNRTISISSIFELTPIIRLSSNSKRVYEVGGANTYYTYIESPFEAKGFDIAQSVGLGIEFISKKQKDLFIDIQAGNRSIPIRPINDNAARNLSTYLSVSLRRSI